MAFLLKATFVLDISRETEMDDLLVSFQVLNSTCYVLTESHSKEQNHNRFSQTGI